MITTEGQGKRLLRDREAKIEKGLEDFFRAGQELKAIRDDELYRHDGFTTWAEYCTRRWDFSKRQCDRLIIASEYRRGLPSPDVGPNGSHQWSERAVRELTRIEDRKQAGRVAAKVVKAIEKSYQDAEKNPDVKPMKLSAAVVRKAVDADLGVDRAKQAAETKRERENYRPKLRDYLLSKMDVFQAIREKLAEVPDDAWEMLEQDNPGLTNEWVDACDLLAMPATPYVTKPQKDPYDILVNHLRDTILTFKLTFEEEDRITIKGADEWTDSQLETMQNELEQIADWAKHGADIVRKSREQRKNEDE